MDDLGLSMNNGLSITFPAVPWYETALKIGEPIALFILIAAFLSWVVYVLINKAAGP